MLRTSSEGGRGKRDAIKFLAVMAIAMAALLWGPVPAHADAALDSLRANGAVAERFDGYVEVRDANAGANAKAVVNEVNAKRRTLYKKRAKESNVQVSEVGKPFATKIVETAPPGTYFRQQGGGYVRK